MISWLIIPYAYATVADGVLAYEKGNYRQARAEWLPYAALGNANALYNLGQLFRTGRGVDVNYITAEYYYRRAAEKGHVGAERNLGTLYYFGRTGKIDYDQALLWLTKAAASGDVRSQLMVGTMSFNGYGRKKDSISAYAWIYLAAQSGLRNAQDSLIKLEGIMTPEQVAQAKTLSAKIICEQKCPDDGKQNVHQPEPPEVKNTAPPTLAGNADKFRVQLGSYHTENAAKMAFKELATKFSVLIKQHTAAFEFADLREKGVFYRLQIKSFGQKNEALNFCEKLKENDQDCYVVKAP